MNYSNFKCLNSDDECTYEINVQYGANVLDISFWQDGELCDTREIIKDDAIELALYILRQVSQNTSSI